MPEQYKVPQEVESEDTIIGPLTMKQFLKLVVGCIFAYFVYVAYPKIYFFFLGIPILVFSFLVAFVKINGQPFEKFLWASITFFFRPQKRIWKKIPENKEEKIITPQKKDTVLPPKKVSKSELERLAYILDTRGYVNPPEEEKEEDELERLKEILIEKRSHQEEENFSVSIEDILKKKNEK